MSKTADALEQLRDLPDDELLRALDRTRDEQFRIKLGMHTNQVASPAQLRSFDGADNPLRCPLKREFQRAIASA